MSLMAIAVLFRSEACYLDVMGCIGLQGYVPNIWNSVANWSALHSINACDGILPRVIVQRREINRRTKKKR
jgi:hypothetical protein